MTNVSTRNEEQLIEAREVLSTIVARLDETVALSVRGWRRFLNDVFQIRITFPREYTDFPRRQGLLSSAYGAITSEALAKVKEEPDWVAPAFEEMISYAKHYYPRNRSMFWIITSQRIEKIPYKAGLKRDLPDIAAVLEAEASFQGLLRDGQRGGDQY